MTANITTQSEDVERAISHLRHRVERSHASDDFAEDEIAAAIRDRGWVPHVVGGPGDWTIEIEDHRAPEQGRLAVAHNPDRRAALLETLGIALTWLTPEEEDRLFDDLCRRLVGMSAAEFIARWQNDELGDIPESTATHVLLSRPLGR